MLIISRKQGEVIVLGDSIEVCVLDIQGDRIKLGISAPKEVKVFRKELLEITQVNVEAAGSKSSAELMKKLKNAIKLK